MKYVECGMGHGNVTHPESAYMVLMTASSLVLLTSSREMVCWSLEQKLSSSANLLLKILLG